MKRDSPMLPNVRTHDRESVNAECHHTDASDADDEDDCYCL